MFKKYKNHFSVHFHLWKWVTFSTLTSYLLNLFPKTKTILHDIGLQHLNIIHLLDLKRTEDNVPLSSDTASLHVQA